MKIVLDSNSPIMRSHQVSSTVSSICRDCPP